MSFLLAALTVLRRHPMSVDIECGSRLPILYYLFYLGFYVPLENTFKGERVDILNYNRNSMPLSSNMGNMARLL